MSEKKRLAVVTSTRAEYGLLRTVLLRLQHSIALEPLLVVTGTHLSAVHGGTAAEIEADGLPITARIPILADSPEPTAQTIARTVDRFSAWFAANAPDAVLLLGDRFEIFAVAVAAACQKVPVCHISGGDVTLGAADEYYRHCITKMAVLHFPSCPESAARVVRMGEPPQTVFCVGGLGDENIRTMPKMSRENLCISTGLPLQRPFALVTFHPETAGRADPAAQVEALCAAMEQTPGVFWLITGSNADAGGALCSRRLRAFAAQNSQSAAFVQSLGVKRYLSAMQYAALVLGNSSSGVVETPSFGVPAVNIGSRQDGRPVCCNVICCAAQPQAILPAVARALTPAFAAQAKTAQSPYDGGCTSGRIVHALEQELYRPGFGAPKRFYDGPVPPFVLTQEEPV
jgi:UDP-hydrolysing UDP-N-acetyl-D-glucosamine 2-epimerase